jgi:hypothetical protein
MGDGVVGLVSRDAFFGRVAAVAFDRHRVVTASLVHRSRRSVDPESGRDRLQDGLRGNTALLLQEEHCTRALREPTVDRGEPHASLARECVPTRLCRGFRG